MPNTPIATLPYPASSDPPNGPAAFSALASAVDNKLVPRFSNATTRNAAITAPSAGMVCWLTTPGRFEYYTGSAWAKLVDPAMNTTIAFTPTWRVNNTAVTIGNGTAAGTYTRIGQLVHAEFTLAVGSTTSFNGATGTMTVDAPGGLTSLSGAANDFGLVGAAHIRAGASSATVRNWIARWFFPIAGKFTFVDASDVALTHALPAAWQSGNSIRASVAYLTSAAP